MPNYCYSILIDAPYSPGIVALSVVTMQAPKEIPQDYHCKDKFLVQSVVVQEGVTNKDIVPEMVSCSCSTRVSGDYPQKTICGD
jgi:hypothetical protein